MYRFGVEFIDHLYTVSTYGFEWYVIGSTLGVHESGWLCMLFITDWVELTSWDRRAEKVQLEFGQWSHVVEWYQSKGSMDDLYTLNSLEKYGLYHCTDWRWVQYIVYGRVEVHSSYYVRWLRTRYIVRIDPSYRARARWSIWVLIKEFKS